MSGHDPKTCNLCAMLRHPALARQTAELKAHLNKHPFPKQEKKQ